MNNVGRNEPCTCGSGKKYKKCCLEKDLAPSNELFRQRLQTMRNALISKILKHADLVYGPHAIHEAWDEFHLWENEEPFDPNAREMPVFMPFFFYDWHPDETGTNMNPNAPRDLVPALSLLEIRGSRLTELEQHYIKECCSRALTFYEVLESWPGKGIKANDILTGESFEIVERAGSESMRAGDIVFGKAVTLQKLTTLECCSTYLIPPKFKLEILNLKKALRRGSRPLTQKHLREDYLDVLQLYQDIREALENPKMPVLQNTDGDLMVPHKLTYEIESLETTLEALAPLSLIMTKDEIFEGIEDASNGKKSVEFSWNKKGNKKHKTWNHTVMGHIHIVGNQMVVEVNSAKRANLFESKLKKIISTGFKLKSKVIEPIDLYLKNNSPKEKTEDDLKNEELNNRPEVQEALAAMMKKHWEQWVKDKIPALGNITPLEATMTSDGREALDALLTQFERDAERQSIPGQSVETFKSLRDRLGM